MKTYINRISIAAALCLGALTLSNCATGPAARMNSATTSRSELNRKSQRALGDLYAQNPAALRLSKRAAGVLVFPEIAKAGFMVGVEGGNGTLVLRGQSARRYYQTAGASYGLQAGVQKYGYALFLMHDSDVRNLDRAGGWEVGSSPSLVVVDHGIASSLTTKTMEKGTYAFFFDQKGLMAGIGLKGSKITRIHPEG